MSVPVLIGTTNPAKVKRFERLLDGKDVEQSVTIPVELITEENVDQYDMNRWQ